MVDLTVPWDLPYDNIVPDVMVVNTLLSQLPEMAEVTIAMFAPVLETLRPAILFGQFDRSHGLRGSTGRSAAHVTLNVNPRGSKERGCSDITSSSNGNGTNGRPAPHSLEYDSILCFSPWNAVLGRNVLQQLATSTFTCTRLICALGRRTYVLLRSRHTRTWLQSHACYSP